jgi:glucose-6-phosphate isomerase
MAISFDRLRVDAARLRQVALTELFDADPERCHALAFRHGPVFADLSRQRIDLAALASLIQAARDAGLEKAIEGLFAGAEVNVSERRPALHTALRGVGPADAVRRAADAIERMERLIELLRHDPSSTFGMNRVTDVVSVGIGGSDLGPRLLLDALERRSRGLPRVHFVSNVDGDVLQRLLPRLDPGTTLVVLISKSFGTSETLINGHSLIEWMQRHHGGNRDAALRQFMAVTADTDRAATFGIARSRILPLWPWVGGRLSLWSCVGFAVALAVGPGVFRRLQQGAASMDEHFRDAPLEANLPVLLALVGLWNRNLMACPSHALVPYADRLRLLPAWLQQLDMESNGKSVGPDGRPVDMATAPVIWGGVGTDAQHAFFQCLHQGTDVLPVEFIGVVRPTHDFDAHHRALLANLLAQGAALMRGQSTEQALERLRDSGLHGAELLALAAQQTFPGNRPSTTLLLDDLEPESLGALLALYEHRTYVQGVLWGIDPFDQWGVELGKRLAEQIEPALTGAPPPAEADASTRALLAEILSRQDA